MAKLILHRNILRNFAKYPASVQKRVAEFVSEFEANPADPRLYVHPLKATMRDPKVRGAELPSGYRAIIVAPEQGETYLLVYIDKHDAAYAWAANKLFEVHPNTGTFQIVDVEETERVMPPSKPISARHGSYPLVALDDEELFRAGVPRALIPAVQRVESDDMLDALAPYLPPDCRDVLYSIAAGLEVDEAVESLFDTSLTIGAPSPPTSTGDFSHLLNGRNYDLVVIDAEEDLRKMLQATTPIEEWRVFLHPLQKRLVEWKTKGPMCITGAAGTGKTVALMHRAVHLASRKLSSGGYPSVLITTFTSNLAITIKDQIQRLVKPQSGRLEVVNLHRLARMICQRSGWEGEVASEDTLEKIWAELSSCDLHTGNLDWLEVKREFEDIIDPFGIWTEDAYLTTIRSGRPRVIRENRRALWKIFSEFRGRLKSARLATEDGLIHEARLSIEDSPQFAFDHVLVDEAQDFSLEELRLIAVLSRVGEERTDPLCIVGDAHQRIHRAKVPLGRAGINVRGRSRRLKINYRTTEEIRRFAHSRLHGVPIDDLDDGQTSTVGDRSIVNGPKPDILHCKTEIEQAKYLKDWIDTIKDQLGMRDHEICLTTESALLSSELARQGIRVYELKPNQADPGGLEPGVRIASRKRIKGLEYRAVAICCSSEEAEESKASIEQRCEWYVAATRARECLLLLMTSQ